MRINTPLDLEVRRTFIQKEIPQSLRTAFLQGNLLMKQDINIIPTHVECADNMLANLSCWASPAGAN